MLVVLTTRIPKKVSYEGHDYFHDKILSLHLGYLEAYTGIMAHYSQNYPFDKINIQSDFDDTH